MPPLTEPEKVSAPADAALDTARSLPSVTGAEIVSVAVLPDVAFDIAAAPDATCIVNEPPFGARVTPKNPEVVSPRLMVPVVTDWLRLIVWAPARFTLRFATLPTAFGNVPVVQFDGDASQSKVPAAVWFHVYAWPQADGQISAATSMTAAGQTQPRVRSTALKERKSPMMPMRERRCPIRRTRACVDPPLSRPTAKVYRPDAAGKTGGIRGLQG